jgi:hypothetical protein
VYPEIESDQMTPKYGVYEGFPAVWTLREAWVCVDRKWHPFSVADAVFYAALLSKADFTERYHHLPALPSNAFCRDGC